MPGALHSLHGQTIEWIFSHGTHAVVTTSQLHTRGETPPIPSNTVARTFSVPAPPLLSPNDAEFSITVLPSQPDTPELTDEFGGDDRGDIESVQPGAEVQSVSIQFSFQ